MRQYAIWTKCIAFFLAVLTFLGVALGGLGVLVVGNAGMYNQDSYESWITQEYESRAEGMAREVIQDYGGSLSDCPDWLLEQLGLRSNLKYVENWYEIADHAWRYSVVNADGAVVYSNITASFAENALSFSFAQDVTYPSLAKDVNRNETFVNTDTGEEVDVQWQQESDLRVFIWITRDDAMIQSNGLPAGVLEELFRLRYAFILTIAVSFLLLVAVMVWLLSIAGRNPHTGELTPGVLNRIPLDLYFLLAGSVSSLGVVAVYNLLQIMFHSSYYVLFLVLMCGLGVLVSAVDIGFLTALSAQCKLGGGSWWKRSICGRVLLWAWKYVKRIFLWAWKWVCRAGKGTEALLEMLPAVWEWLLVGAILAVVLLGLMVAAFESSSVLLVLFAWLICAAVVGYGGYCFGTIRKGIQRLKAGDLNEKINTQYMVGSFLRVAEDLNALTDVVKLAAEKQLKSERMKTELITNVSHDIKTPLTSLINYVDLLQQPHTEEEGKQYLEVLSRQSQQMKKLLEDLMEMSKASTGNVQVNITTLDAVEAVNQALGEFSDKLAAAQLTPLFRPTEPQMPIQADGRITWRVLSNLLGNVVKYALPGTRVYLDLQRQGSKVVFSIKNISREELNISAQELTERFVRGDAARNTEGSGLGLNIAQSLMNLQKGTLELTVDGDLFKVTLTFPGESGMIGL